LKIVVANHVAVEIAHALSLQIESVPFNENSLSVLRVAAQKFVPQVFQAVRSREKRKNEDLEGNCFLVLSL